MKVRTVLLVIATGLFFSACSHTGPAVTSTTAPAVTAAPERLDDLSKELDLTIDDGGQADLKTLEKEAAGL